MTQQVTIPPHGAALRALHWGSALLVVAAWVVGITMDGVPRGPARGVAMQVHYSLGVLVLGFAALRVVRYAMAPAVSEGPVWQRVSAAAMHWALLGMTVGVPLTGLLDRWARGRAVAVFGGLELPAPFAVPGGKMWGGAHEMLAWALAVAVAAHVAAALWHQLVLRDGTLARMLPRRASVA